MHQALGSILSRSWVAPLHEILLRTIPICRDEGDIEVNSKFARWLSCAVCPVLRSGTEPSQATACTNMCAHSHSSLLIQHCHFRYKFSYLRRKHKVSVTTPV